MRGTISMGKIKNVVVFSIPSLAGDQNISALIDRLYQIRQQYRSDTMPLDFTNVVPMNPILKETPSTAEADKAYYIYCQLTGKPVDKAVSDLYEPFFKNKFNELNFSGHNAYNKFLEAYSKDYATRLDLSVGETLYNNLQRYGSRHWVDFRDKYWGTRYNASNSQELGFDTIIFETERTAPTGIYSKLAQENRDVVMLVASVNLENANDNFVARYVNGVNDNFNTGNFVAGDCLLKHWKGKPYSVATDNFYNFYRNTNMFYKAVRDSFVSGGLDYETLYNVLPTTPFVKVDPYIPDVKKTPSKSTPVIEATKEASPQKEDDKPKSFGGFISSLFNNTNKENKFGDESR